MVRGPEFDLSVIVAFHNAGPYLGPAVQSVLDQTIYPSRVEIVLVDDASSDESAVTAADYARRIGNVTLYHLEPPATGPSRPRNLAIDKARGRFLMFLDGDDLLFEGASETLLEVATDDAAEVVSGLFHLYDGTTSWLPAEMRHFLGKELRATTVERSPWILAVPQVHWTKIFRRSLLVEHAIRFAPLTVGEDVLFSITAILAAHSASFVDTPIVKYRQRGASDRGSITARMTPRKLTDLVKSKTMIRRAFEERGLGALYESRFLAVDIGQLFRLIRVGFRRDSADVHAFLREAQRYIATIPDSVVIELPEHWRDAIELMCSGRYRESMRLITGANPGATETTVELPRAHGRNPA